MSRTDVDPTNQAQAEAWDGREGEYWAAHHEQFDAVLAGYQPDFHAACGLRADDDVLDVGCGAGGTTITAARTARLGTALGIDLSSRMLAVARESAAREGVANVRFEHADAQVQAFPTAGFDAVISRTGAMFFGDPERAFRNLSRALRPKGRLTLLTWQSSARNPWFGALAGALLGAAPAPPPGAPGPFSMSEPDRVHRLLTGAGLREVEVTGLVRPLTYGRTVDEAYDFLLGLLRWMLEQRSPEDRPRAAAALRELLAEHASSAGVQFESATWLITAHGS